MSMFQENAKKHSAKQIIGIVCIFILALLIVCTFVLYGIFKDDNTAPSFFGRRVYIMNGDGMEPRISQGAAVFVDEGVLPTDVGNVILCNIDGRLAVVGYVGSQEVTLPDGTVESRYIVKYDNAPADEIWAVEESDIIGRAVSYDAFLGAVIRFASSKVGMLLVVIIPCAALVIYEVVMLILSLRKGKIKPASESDASEYELYGDGDIKDNLFKEKERTAEMNYSSDDGEKNPYGFGNGSVNIASKAVKSAAVRSSAHQETIRNASHAIPEDALQEPSAPKLRFESETQQSVKSQPVPQIDFESAHKSSELQQGSSIQFETESESRSQPLPAVEFDLKSEPKFTPEPSAGTEPAQSTADVHTDSASDNMRSRIDELIKLLEEEKAKLADK